MADFRITPVNLPCRPPTTLSWKLEADMKLAGFLQLNIRDGEVGFGILPAHRKMGYASRAVKWVVEYASEITELHRLCAVTRRDNRAARLVLERCGFRPASPVGLAGKHVGVDFLFFSKELAGRVLKTETVSAYPDKMG